MSDEERQPRTVSLKLSAALIARLDGLKGEYGLRSRGAIVERLLNELFAPEPDQSGGGGAAAAEGAGSEPPSQSDGAFDERGALVLVNRGGPDQLALDLALRPEHPDPAYPELPDSPPRNRGIDLPGFVRRQSDQLRRSLHPRPPASADSLDPLPQVQGELVQQALERVRSHWHELYGSDANGAVLEAAMVWLAQDIWPQSDQSEGRPFSWSLATEVMRNLAADWPVDAPSFERVMVAAGVLEDPFSCSTLVLRLPTLIRRFVHRFRRRRGTSFHTLEHTMSLHGALKLLQLPTAAGQRLTLPQIREAYREMALAHHPDSGGSEEAMRRLNEAYQLLKELYRNPTA
ncbi:MAG: DnaJ domain-containing protein [Cyanobacteria bacterium]|nr:DnaJ domain-containing protein [Cyanobacteriota bacterium]